MELKAPRSGLPLSEVADDYLWNLSVSFPTASDERRDEEDDDDEYRLRGQPLPTRAVSADQATAPGTPAVDRPSHRAVRAPGEPYATNLRLICELLGLSDAEAQVLTFFVAGYWHRELASVCSSFGRLHLGNCVQVIAEATQVSEESVRAALGNRGALLSSGVLERENRFAVPVHDMFDLLHGVPDLLMLQGLTRADFMLRYLPESTPTHLTLADYPHLGRCVQDLCALLREALRQGHRGVNVLLHGETGAGKTALARALADALSVPLYSPSCEDNHGHPASPSERLASLRLGQRMMVPRSGLLLFDELEDFLGGESEHGDGRISKLWLNLLLEGNAIPTVWLANDLGGADIALLRRFSYVVEFGTPTGAQRKRILERYLGDHPSIAAGERRALAARFEVSPAQLAAGVRVARFIDPAFDAQTLERVLEPVANLVQGWLPRSPAFNPDAYSPDAVHASEDLQALADAVAGFRPGSTAGLSFCLYGVPGTGKSQYVHYLAHRMGREVLYRHASDLLRPYHGETEERIARAFRTAERQDALLLFDEVDTFLRDRQQLAHSWEASAVNEFLQQLEQCRGVVACTTNLLGHLDPASMRRFVFKVELLPLTPAQSARHFARVFGDLLETPLSEAARQALPTRLGALTPGDMAVVARRLAALGKRRTLDRIVGALQEEARLARPSAGPVGFRAAGAPRLRARGRGNAAD